MQSINKKLYFVYTSLLNMSTNNHLFICNNFSYMFRPTEAILRDKTDKNNAFLYKMSTWFYISQVELKLQYKSGENTD
jgi:hypothetical protein